MSAAVSPRLSLWFLIGNVWPLSGFLVHSVLLGGATCDNQIVPAQDKLLILSFISAALSFGMQFSLTWYLWVNLPVHNRNSVTNEPDPYPPSLTNVWAPDINGLDELSVCRSQPLIQVWPLCLEYAAPLK